MARARDDIHVAIAQTLGGIAHGGDTALVESGRLELAYDLGLKAHADRLAHARRAGHQFVDHAVQLVGQVRAHIHGKDDLAGDHVAAVGIDVDMADGAHGARLVLHRDLVDKLGDESQAPARVLAHMHGRRAGVAVLARHRAFDPAQALPVGDNADLFALGLEDRALLDVQLEHRVHFALADLFWALPADPLELVAKAFALGVNPVIGPVEAVPAGENTRGEHGRGKARAFLVGPVGHDDWVLGLDPEVVHRADHLKAAENAQNTVILAASRLGIEVAADIDRQGLGVGPLAAGKHIADLVNRHCHAGRLAPALEQVAAFAVFIGQGLAVVATRNSRADLGHFHQAIPKPLAVDLKILSGCGHRAFLLSSRQSWCACEKA